MRWWPWLLTLWKVHAFRRWQNVLLTTSHKNFVNAHLSESLCKLKFSSITFVFHFNSLYKYFSRAKSRNYIKSDAFMRSTNWINMKNMLKLLSSLITSGIKFSIVYKFNRKFNWFFLCISFCCSRRIFLIFTS